MADKLPKKKAGKHKIKKVSRKKRELLVVSEVCKNCSEPLDLDQQFCARCGAKRIYNRLNAKNLFEDFTERFLNIENAFLKTFIALWVQPEDVINGYINGLRKRYMSAFSYFAVALTLGSIYIFLFRNLMLAETSELGEMFSGFQEGMQSQGVKSSFEFANLFLDYNSFLSFLFIPFYAILSKIIFWNYKHVNFIEHVVIYLYAYAQAQILSNGLLILFAWSGMAQLIISSFISIVPFFYTAYVLYRVFDLNMQQLLLKTLFFLLILLPFSCIFFSVIGSGMYATGVFDGMIESIKADHEQRKVAKDSMKAAREMLSKDTLTHVIKSFKDTLHTAVPQ